MKTIPIEVTINHILNGKRDNCGACPVALAIGDALSLRDYVISVSGSWVSLPCWIHDTRIPLPSTVIGFITAFDSGLSVEPFHFDLIIP